MIADDNQVRKHRTTFNALILLLLVGALVLDHYKVALMSLLSGLPEDQIGDRGIEPLQAVIIAMYKLPFGIVYSALLATFLEKQFKDNAFGTLSRWGVCFCLCLYCFTQLAAR